MVTSLFKKILIANRGEIAVRVIRACHELGIGAVAVYSEADISSNHVKFANEAYSLGEKPMSYLSIKKIIKLAKKAEADAIHPGYGFLAENPDFVKACEKEGITFIGPGASAMLTMGNKLLARKTMKGARVPIVPGTTKAINNLEEAKEAIKKIGFPVLIKPAAGGGGKGMMLVHKWEDFSESFESAQRIARSAFGDDEVYLEKYMEKPRHIEVQIMGDKKGNVVHLFERECSVQRRHQKIIEEPPSTFLTEELRKKMCDTAVRAAKAIGYVGAGTIEFIADKNKNFYFMEMNTRLQVEHPITEWVTGVDLVKEQIRVAAGLPLSFKQKDLKQHGHSIECRIYAEDSSNNFTPSPGTITYLEIPEGPFIRNDASIYPHYTVPVYYDPLIAKLSVWASTREAAINKMKDALSRYKILGIRTTESFLRDLLDDSEFRSGHYDTHLVARFLEKKTVKTKYTRAEIYAALIASTIKAYERFSLTPESTSSKSSQWKTVARREGLRDHEL